MNDLRTQVRDTARRRRFNIPTRLVDVTIAAVMALLVTSWAMHDPRRAPDVTIDNDTPYDLTVKVSDGNDAHWMAFASVDAQSQSIVRAPIEQGAVWVFDFGPGGEYSIERSALRESGWHMRVPAIVSERLVAAGVAQSPQLHQG